MRLGLVSVAPPRIWWRLWKHRRNKYASGGVVGIFRNKPGIIPGRWGFYFLGLEIGSRNPGNRFGTWLKRVGLWPW